MGSERSRSISIYWSFSLHLSLAHSSAFQSKSTSNICLECRLRLYLIGYERAARVAPGTPLRESLQRCVKGKHVLHSESQGSLSVLISVMKCLPPPRLSGYRPLHFPKQTCPGQCTRATTPPRPDSTQEWLFFFSRAPL